MLQRTSNLFNLIMYISLFLPMPLLIRDNPDMRIEMTLLVSALILIHLLRYHWIDPDIPNIMAS